MILSTEQKIQMMDALFTYKKEVEFQQMTDKEKKKLYDEYNLVKNQHIKLYHAELKDISQDISDELETKIDTWAENKTLPLSQSNDYDFNFDLTDILFLGLIVAGVNNVTGNVELGRIETFTKNAYEDSASYYLKLEQDKIEKAIGKRPEPESKTLYNPNDPRITNQFNTYTIPAWKTIGDKYKPVMEKILKDGYKNKESISTIADKLKSAVDPSSKLNKTNHIFKRIAATEMSFYTELGKLDSWRSIGIGKKQLVTRHDIHVCPTCQGLDGLILDLDDNSIWIPIHPYCRCTWIPIYDPDMWLIPGFLIPLLDDDDDENT